MSDFLEEKSEMPPRISPVDTPQGGENSDSEEDEPVVPAIMETSSSDDEDNNGIDSDDLTQGYVQLAQDDNDGLQPAEQWLANTGEEEAPHVNDAVIINTSESSMSSSSSSSVDRSAEPEMKQEQVDLIRQVMSGITLPTSAVPEWAKVIPEEKWKASLVSSIKNRTFTEPDSGKSN